MLRIFTVTKAPGNSTEDKITQKRKTLHGKEVVLCHFQWDYSTQNKNISINNITITITLNLNMKNININMKNINININININQKG